MIEKLRTLDDIPTNTQLEKSILTICSTYTNKINELCDAVNELQESQNTYWTDIAEIKKELQTRAENVQQKKGINKEPLDRYIKQRKWVGKLCKFDGENYGILKEIGCSDTKQVWRDGAFRSSDGYWYDFCEPVKPDDDIIFKGE